MKVTLKIDLERQFCLGRGYESEAEEKGKMARSFASEVECCDGSGIVASLGLPSASEINLQARGVVARFAHGFIPMRVK